MFCVGGTALVNSTQPIGSLEPVLMIKVGGMSLFWKMLPSAPFVLSCSSYLPECFSMSVVDIHTSTYGHTVVVVFALRHDT